MPMSVVYTLAPGSGKPGRGGDTLCPDTLGSVIQTRDASGNQTPSTTYWPFGEVRTSSGNNLFYGIWGYYGDAASRLSVRARILTRWLTVDAYWPSIASCQYAFSNPITDTDASGMFPTLDCSGVSNCLKKTPKCGGTKPVSITMMLRVFWQKTSLGHETPPDTLHGKGCFKKLKGYDDFMLNSADYEKAQAGYTFIQVVGLDKYGPGKGKPGDYRGPTGDKIRACVKCIERDVPYQCRHYLGNPIPQLNEICGYCFVTKVHK